MTIKTVYVVDDEQFDRMLYKRVIDKSGLVEKLVVFADAEDALEALQESETRPDLIFLDINMPRMSGFDFLEATDESLSDAQPETSVAMLTTSENPRDRERAEPFKSVRWFLSKPLTNNQLESVAREFA